MFIGCLDLLFCELFLCLLGCLSLSVCENSLFILDSRIFIFHFPQILKIFFMFYMLSLLSGGIFLFCFFKKSELHLLNLKNIVKAHMAC